MDRSHLEELLYQAIETELGGERLYQAAIENAVNSDLREEWQKYLDETRTHQDILQRVFDVAGLDIDTDSPGRAVVRQKGEALVSAVEAARQADDPNIGELVAAESVVEAESKDHQNWELLGRMVEHVDGDLKSALRDAYEEVAEQEAHHLFHTMGWARELWLDYLGVPAALPPPEEEKKVATQIGAGRAEHEREEYLESRVE
jgi:ferritin-like metal-binding protein YciE